MPLDVDSDDYGLRVSLGLRRNPITDRLEAHMELKEHKGDGTTTVQEGIFPVGDDVLYERLQEHSNNYLRRLANEWAKHEKQTRR